MAKQATERKQSPMNEKMFEVEGTTSIGDALPPGSSTVVHDVHFEELGKLSEFPDTQVQHNDGTGEYVVILTDYLSGAGDDDHFSKGDVRRISRVIPGYGDPDVDKNLVRQRVKRLLELKAIRMATAEEQGQEKVEVTLESESDTVTAERNRRISVESENAVLRERLGLAANAAVDATPGQAGASGEAQQAAESEGDKFDE